MKLICPREVKMHKKVLQQDVEYIVGDASGSIWIPNKTNLTRLDRIFESKPGENDPSLAKEIRRKENDE